MLPQNVTLKEKSAVGWAGEPAQMYKAVGRVYITVQNKNLPPSGFPNGGISYTIFPNNSDAESAYDAIRTPSNNSARDIKGFAYPATVFSQSKFGAYTTTVFAMPVENVLVTTEFVQNPDPVNPEKELTDLAKSALEHLKKVGQ